MSVCTLRLDMSIAFIFPTLNPILLLEESEVLEEFLPLNVFGNEELDLDDFPTLFKSFLKFLVSNVSSSSFSSSLESYSSYTTFKVMDFPLFFALKSSQKHEGIPSSLQPSWSQGLWLLQ